MNDAGQCVICLQAQQCVICLQAQRANRRRSSCIIEEYEEQAAVAEDDNIKSSRGDLQDTSAADATEQRSQGWVTEGETVCA